MEVTIIIPNYNGKHFMKECLDSLAHQTEKKFEIIVVDNASTDGSVTYLQEEYPNIKLITLNKNYGFSKAVNEGIKAAKTPYVILLNNDTKAAPSYVENLLKAIKKSPKIFSVSPKMIQLYNPDLLDDAGDLYTIIGWGVARGAGRSVNAFNRADEIFSACAGAAIYRRNIFDEIGYFDENHFAYLEDIDVGYRAKIYGYRNMYCPTATVLHVGSGTSGSKYNTFKVELSARNSVYLNYKNMPFLQLLINLPFLLLGYFVKILFFYKIGFLRDYLNGLKKGVGTCSKQKKVPFKLKHTLSYFLIELELIVNTFHYGIDWLYRKFNKTNN